MVIIVAYELQYSVDFAVSTLRNFTQKLLDTQSIYLCIQLAREWKGQKAWHIGTKQVIETRIADLTRKAVKELLAQKKLTFSHYPTNCLVGDRKTPRTKLQLIRFREWT